MKRLLFVAGLFLMCFVSAAVAADKSWTLKGIFGGTYNQTSVSDNWTGKEKNSKNWGVKLDASAEKKLSNALWTNTLKEEYGKSEVSGSPEEISADVIDFTSLIMYKLSIYANPYASFNMINVNNTFNDPVAYKESAGIGWLFLDRKKQHLALRVGAACVQRFQSNTDAVRETGAEAVSNYDITLSETAKFTTEARLFTAFKDGPNLRWDNNLYLKVSKYLVVALQYLELYDEKRVPKPSWAGDIESRFTVTVGLSYDLF